MFPPFDDKGAMQCEVCGPNKDWLKVPKHIVFFGNILSLMCCDGCSFKVWNLITDNGECKEIDEYGHVYEETMHFRNGGESRYDYDELSEWYFKARKEAGTKIRELIDEKITDRGATLPKVDQS